LKGLIIAVTSFMECSYVVSDNLKLVGKGFAASK